MIRIGVTGQSGFIGKHLYNMLGLFPHEFGRIEFEKHFFKDTSALDAFVCKCDVIVQKREHILKAWLKEIEFMLWGR